MRRRILAALLFTPLLLGVERPQGLADVVEVRHWSYEGYTRVVVELSEAVDSEVVVRPLPADRHADRPERLYLDLAGVWVGRRFVDRIELGDGLLQGVRLGQNTLRTTRLVLDLENYHHHRLIELAHPHRVVIDVYGVRAAKRRGGSGEGIGRDGRLPPDLREVQTVVLDPGHGGRDPGAIGYGGLREKDITLRLARAVGARLEARGFKVKFTRKDDRALGLEERTAIAESVGGDVFISLHANAARRRTISGVETYYLDENHERHSLNLAARENGIEATQVNVLQKTLAKLHMEEVSPLSRRLATLVQKQIVTGMPRRQRPNDLGVKKGPFYVLFLSNMPAILIEAGFLTNKAESRKLRDGDYLEGLAEQIALGLVSYRASDQAAVARRSP